MAASDTYSEFHSKANQYATGEGGLFSAPPPISNLPEVQNQGSRSPRRRQPKVRMAFAVARGTGLRQVHVSSGPMLSDGQQQVEGQLATSHMKTNEAQLVMQPGDGLPEQRRQNQPPNKRQQKAKHARQQDQEQGEGQGQLAAPQQVVNHSTQQEAGHTQQPQGSRRDMQQQQQQAADRQLDPLAHEAQRGQHEPKAAAHAGKRPPGRRQKGLQALPPQGPPQLSEVEQQLPEASTQQSEARQSPQQQAGHHPFQPQQPSAAQQQPLEQAGSRRPQHSAKLRHQARMRPLPMHGAGQGAAQGTPVVDPTASQAQAQAQVRLPEGARMTSPAVADAALSLQAAGTEHRPHAPQPSQPAHAGGDVGDGHSSMPEHGHYSRPEDGHYHGMAYGRGRGKHNKDRRQEGGDAGYQRRPPRAQAVELEGQQGGTGPAGHLAPCGPPGQHPLWYPPDPQPPHDPPWGQAQHHEPSHYQPALHHPAHHPPQTAHHGPHRPQRQQHGPPQQARHSPHQFAQAHHQPLQGDLQFQRQLEERERYYQQQYAAMWQQQGGPQHAQQQRRQTPPPQQPPRSSGGPPMGYPRPSEEWPSWPPPQPQNGPPGAGTPWEGGRWQPEASQGPAAVGEGKAKAMRGRKKGEPKAGGVRPLSSRGQGGEAPRPNRDGFTVTGARGVERARDEGQQPAEDSGALAGDGVPQLVTRLTRKLQEDALECMICVEAVKRQAAIWSCTSCFNIFHLSCIVRWAKSVVAGASSGFGDMLGARGGNSNDFFPSAAASVTIRLPNVGGSGAASAGGSAAGPNPARWRCPACQAMQSADPGSLRSLCLCKRVEDPPVDYFLTPHSCGELCGRERPAGCSHACVLPCHPGPCPPCPALCDPRRCPCAKMEYRPRCAQQAQVETCGAVCGQLLACGRHACKRACHEGPCGACDVEMDVSCFCGGQHKRERCGQLDVVGWPQRDSSAASTRPEDGHGRRTHKNGHVRASNDGEAGGGEQGDDDGGVGGKPLAGASGGCDGDGIHRSTDGIERVYGCGSKCNKPLSCGNHRCERACHPGDCGSCSLAPATVTACPCGRTRLADMPGHRPRASCLDAVPTCERRCHKPLPCLGGHSCAATCHAGACPPCPLSVMRSCRCEAITKEVPCSSTPPQTEILCKTPCGGKKSCRRHRCNERCCPARPRPGLPPSAEADGHTCTLLCSKKLRCGRHPCTQLCHAGYCPPCLEAGMYELACLCGRTRLLPPVPCGSVLPPCGSPCPLPRACGHPSNHACHAESDPCPPCMAPVSAPCVGGHVVLQNIPCATASSGSSIRCSASCGQMLPCGMHRCRRSCHAPPCLDVPVTDAAAIAVTAGISTQVGAANKRVAASALSCQQKCGAERRDCGHPCAATCHPGQSCPTEPCREKVVIRCVCGRLSACVSCTAGRPSSGSPDPAHAKDWAEGTEAGCAEPCGGAWGALLYDVAAEIRALPTRLVDAVKPAQVTATVSPLERGTPAQSQSGMLPQPPSPPPPQLTAAKERGGQKGGADLDMGGAREEAIRILSGRADPLGQRTLECDAECLKSEKRRLLAEAFGATPPLAPGEVGADGLTEAAHELLRRDLTWAAAVESRIAALCAGVAGRGAGSSVLSASGAPRGAAGVAGTNASSASRASSGGAMPAGLVDAPRSRVHVFRPLNEKERQAVHELAALWSARSCSVGREPHKLVTVWSIPGVSRPPPKGPVCRRLTPAASSMSFVLAPPDFDAKLDMDPLRVLSLPNLPPDCNVGSQLARFGTECNLVWLDDANAVAVFDCRQRAGSALRLLDHAVAYQGACAAPHEAQAVEDRAGRGSLKNLATGRGVEDVGPSSKPLVVALRPMVIPVRNAWDALADTNTANPNGRAVDAGKGKDGKPDVNGRVDASRSGGEGVWQAEAKSARGTLPAKQAAAVLDSRKLDFSKERDELLELLKDDKEVA